MFRYSIATALFLFTAITAAATDSKYLDAFKDSRGKLKISCDALCMPVMKEAAERISSYNAAVEISISRKKNEEAEKELKNGKSDVAAYSTANSENDKNTASTFALWAVTVAVNPTNRISDLSVQQIQKVYKGIIIYWKELGGTITKISLLGFPRRSLNTETFAWQILGIKILPKEYLPVFSTKDMNIIISKDVGAIGFLPSSLVEHTKVKAVRINGIFPSTRTIEKGQYPFSRRLIIRSNRKNPLAVPFEEYIKGPAGKEIIKNCGYMPSKDH